REIDFVNEKWFKYAASPHMFPESHPEDKNIWDEWATSVVNDNSLELEIRLREIDSPVFRFHLLRIIPIKENNTVVKWVGTFTDIDEQKQIEKKKDEFLSIASHELKTPLTSIKAYIQLLERRVEIRQDSTSNMYISRVQTQLAKLNSF